MTRTRQQSREGWGMRAGFAWAMLIVLAAPVALGQAARDPKPAPIDLEEVARTPASPVIAPAQPTEPPAAKAPAEPDAPPSAQPAAREKPVSDTAPTGLVRQGVKSTVRRISEGSGQVEVRRVFPAMGGGTLVDKWRSEIKVGDEMSGIVDVRSGVKGRIALGLEGGTIVEADRLTRVRVGRMSIGSEDGSATRVVVELVNGRVAVWPAAGTSVNVLTADGVTVVREAARVSHDAVRGTMVSAVTEAAPAAPAKGTGR